jgi:energy-coupling factor transporter ATP-binding protein EcfA2
MSARIAKISIHDFRAFPGNGTSYDFDLGTEGKNLLLHGENGSGKSSLFHALRLLLSDHAPDKPFADYRHVFTQGQEGTITIVLTGVPPQDFKWEYDEEHPASGAGGTPFFELARRATFLDYKALLKTSFVHEGADHVNVFPLLVDTLLRDAKLPDGKTVQERWQALRSFSPKPPPPKKPDESEEDYQEALKELIAGDEKQVNDVAKLFSDQLNDLLNAVDVGVIAKANQFLTRLTAIPMINSAGELAEKNTLTIELTVKDLKVKISTSGTVQPPHQFEGADIILGAHYAGRAVAHPAVFLNEARLTAIALSIYLATTLVVIPKSVTSQMPRLLVLDDALIGLDLGHRLPILEILKGPDFVDWQIVLLTYDTGWFEMAQEQLPSWLPVRLYAEVHPDGWEKPILDAEAPYLDRAWNHIQSGDFRGAGVYVRSAFESVLRDFCEHRQLAIPFRRNARDYSSEDYWPLVRDYQVKSGQRLIDDNLAGQIKTCRRFVLNPLCHNDPARPTREEVRHAHAAVFRLNTLLDQDISWRKQLDSKLQAAVKPLIGDNDKQRKKALNGLSPVNDFALACACRLLAAPNPPLSDISGLLRSAFDKGLWNYCARKNIAFTFKCDECLKTEQLWHSAVSGAGGLLASQPAFVAGIEAHRDLMVGDAPARDILEAKTKTDLELLRDTLRGTSPTDNPRCVLSTW